ncbi:HlyD family efflux transporter periplasmic adaptor subunit [Lactobacillus taiwanensis]|uniref:HlyD family efflux transporter periplasmic adaptor subunit n=1 Tax=Lactobacillus taiwanensis TaxID=508451 RepID=UPI0025AF4557|nr:HlyD family efflux transporter periplasmic adaptor subunit [Lactobacillus taiwanensis]
MEQNFFESSEFYSNRYKNFSILIIIPCFIIFISIIIFLFLGKKEIAINGIGYISPVSQEAVIQSTMDSDIEKNSLKEGKHVTKGEKLVVYKDPNSEKKKYSIKQKEQLENQLKSLSILKLGVQKNIDIFSYTDQFGYHNELKAYLTQISIYNQQNNILRSQNDAKKDNKITDYNININNSKIELLQSEKLSEISKEENKLQQLINDLNSEIKISNQCNTIISAPISGVLHVNADYLGMNKVSTGSTLAKIYPDLNSLKKVKLTAYISQKDISSIHKGQLLKFNITTNNSKVLILEGQINMISTSTVKIKGEEVYQVSAITKTISKQKIQAIKYGMQGNTTIITGKTTFFNYYKDKFLNK